MEIFFVAKRAFRKASVGVFNITVGSWSGERLVATLAVAIAHRCHPPSSSLAPLPSPSQIRHNNNLGGGGPVVAGVVEEMYYTQVKEKETRKSGAREGTSACRETVTN